MCVFIHLQASAEMNGQELSRVRPLFLYLWRAPCRKVLIDVYSSVTSPKPMWLLTFIKWHFSCFPTPKVFLSQFCPMGHLCHWCLKEARSFPLLPLKVPLFFPPFYSSYNQQFLDSVCKINNPLYEKAQIGNVTFWLFFVGWGEFYCVFIKSPKKKANIKYSKVTCCFLHFQTSIKLLWAGTRTQQVLLILTQDEDFNARHDITVFACATSSGFIPFSFVLTQMILSNIIWSLFWLGVLTHV